MWIHALVQKSLIKTLLAHIIVLHFPYFPVLYKSYTAVQPSKPPAWTFLDLGFKLQSWIIDKLHVLAESTVGTSLINQMCIHLASLPPEIANIYTKTFIFSSCKAF